MVLVRCNKCGWIGKDEEYPAGVCRLMMGGE